LESRVLVQKEIELFNKKKLEKLEMDNFIIELISLDEDKPYELPIRIQGFKPPSRIIPRSSDEEIYGQPKISQSANVQQNYFLESNKATGKRTYNEFDEELNNEWGIQSISRKENEMQSAMKNGTNMANNERFSSFKQPQIGSKDVTTINSSHSKRSSSSSSSSYPPSSNYPPNSTFLSETTMKNTNLNSLAPEETQSISNLAGTGAIRGSMMRVTTSIWDD
jgi:hypothetical protein